MKPKEYLKPTTAKPVELPMPPPSGSSGCSGADAGQADNRSEDLAGKIIEELLNNGYLEVPILDGQPFAMVCEILKRSAVSERSSDGQAWLSEYETFLEKQYAEYVESYRLTNHPIDAGYAQGLMRARLEFDRLRTQGHS